MPQQRGQRYRSPVGLFPLARALNGPRDIHHRALAGHHPRQRDDLLFRDTGNRRRPARRFRYPVALPEQIGTIRFKTYRMAGDKLRIVQ